MNGLSWVPAAASNEGFICPSLNEKCWDGNPCDDGAFCFYSAEEQCGAGGGSGVCLPKPEACAEILEGLLSDSERTAEKWAAIEAHSEERPLE